MHSNCDECTRLWSEYALATRHYLKVESKLGLAGTVRDSCALRQLAPVLERADLERRRLRNEIDRHDTEWVAGAGSA